MFQLFIYQNRYSFNIFFLFVATFLIFMGFFPDFFFNTVYAQSSPEVVFYTHTIDDPAHETGSLYTD